ncbi:MAG: hypothetical protein J6568_07040 [Snodgrassella sp.]|nr:hypothetical protein [Snodgrassella sp.]
MFEVPQTAGNCILLGFVAGNNATTPLNVTVSFRLKEYPDIVISFSENTRSFTHSLNFNTNDEISLF